MTQYKNTLLNIIVLVLGVMIGWFLSNNWPLERNDSSGEYVATINGKGISKEWFEEQMARRGGLKAGQFQTVAQKNNLLQFLINEEVMYQKAVDAGWHTDSTIQELVKKTTIDLFLENTLQKNLAEVSVKNSEMENHFANNQIKYNQPQRRRAAIIFAETTENTSPEQKDAQKQKLKDVLEQMDTLDSNTKHFGSLALTYSDERASKYQGGVIGWLIDHPDRKYKWPQPIIKTLFELEENGDVSDIIEAENGFYLVRLVDSEQVREKSFNQVKNGIKNKLLQEKKRAVREQFITSLIDDADIVIYEKTLAQVPTLSAPKDKSENKPPALPNIGEVQ